MRPTPLLGKSKKERRHKIHASSLGSGASVGGGEVEVISRRSGSGSDYDQEQLSVKSENHTPSPARRNVFGRSARNDVSSGSSLPVTKGAVVGNKLHLHFRTPEKV